MDNMNKEKLISFLKEHCYEEFKLYMFKWLKTEIPFFEYLTKQFNPIYNDFKKINFNWNMIDGYVGSELNNEK